MVFALFRKNSVYGIGVEAANIEHGVVWMNLRWTKQSCVLLSPGNPEGHCDYVTRRVTMPEPRATQNL
jgi:hypothetical protein